MLPLPRGEGKPPPTHCLHGWVGGVGKVNSVISMQNVASAIVEFMPATKKCPRGRNDYQVWNFTKKMTFEKKILNSDFKVN